MKKITLILLLLLVIMFAVISTGCSENANSNGSNGNVGGSNGSEGLLSGGENGDSEKSINVEFWADDKLYHSKSVTLGADKIDCPEEPTKDDAIFKGWYSDAPYYQCKYNFDYVVTENIRLFAYFDYSECVVDNLILNLDTDNDGNKIYWVAGFVNDELGDLVIPSSFCGTPICYISPYAFAYSESLTSVIIPDSVTRISQGAFIYCKNLKKIALGNGVECIESNAFEACDALEKVAFPDSLKLLSPFAFWSCDNLKNVEFGGDNLYAINECTFYDCEMLEKVVLPSSLSSIGSNAFAECDSLKSIVFPDSLTRICDSAFYSCVSLRCVKIGENVSYIGEDAFSACDNMFAVVIPKAVEHIGIDAFEYNYKQTLYFESKHPDASFVGCAYYYEYHTIFGYDKYIYDECYDYVIIDGEARIINNKNQCAEPTLPTVAGGCAVTFFGNVFSHDETLVKITVSGSISNVERGAFSWCVNLEEVVVEEGVVDIGANAFLRCDKLQYVVVPLSVVTIGNDILLGANSHAIIYCTAETKPMGFDDDWNEDNFTVYWGDKWCWVNGKPTVKQ